MLLDALRPLTLPGVGVLVACAACAAIYPEVTTPLRTAVAAQQLDPPPPDDLFWVSIREGIAPEKTRDGRSWHELGDKLPDPFVVVFLNGKELLRTNPESHSLHPTWPDAPRGNFRIQRSDRVRIEMWQAGLVQKPMCVKDAPGDTSDWVAARQIRIQCDGMNEGGAEVTIAWEPAHGQVGYGFYYELRTQDIYSTRVFEESPAARAGMRSGDQIVTINGRPAREMKPGEIQSFFNAPKPAGIELEVRHSNSAVASLSIKEGSVYPLFSEVGSSP
jgi:hypothetical protein